MKRFTLRGIAEGLVGASVAEASSLEDLLARFPALADHRDALVVDGTRISGFTPCDG